MNYSNLNYYKIKQGDFKDLKILLINVKSLLNITVGFMVNAGSRNETKAFGIAHFLEHMTFKGTTNRSSDELLRELDMLGTKYNAYTSNENTAYFISGDPATLNELIDIALDLYINPKYPDNEISKERLVVFDEYLMNIDNNYRFLSQEIFKNIFSETNPSLARPIIGYEETIKNFNKEDILDFKKKNYINKKSLFIISGNFNKNKIKKQLALFFNSKLKKLFSKNNKNIFTDLIIKEPTILPICNNKIKKYIHFDKDISQSIVIFAFNGYNCYNENLLYLNFIADLLSTGMSSRLFKLLRGKLGITYTNASFIHTFVDAGLFFIKIAVDHKSVLLAIENILNEIKNLKNNIEPSELLRIKNQNKVDVLFQFNNAEDYFMHYGHCFLNKLEITTIKDYIEKINMINIDKLKLILNELFKPKNLIIGTIGKNTEYSIDKIEKLIDSF